MSRTYRKRRQRQQMTRRHRRRIAGAVLGGIFACATLAGYGVYQYLKGDEAWPTIQTIKPERVGENSVVYAADGTRMGVIESDQNRTIITYDKMGKWAPKAAVAIEDRRFYEHPGVDPEGVVRAAFRNVESGSAQQGASTITQQVVRNIYREITTEKTLSRKAKEASLAYQLEGIWTKRQILETYLNVIFFGHNAYGLEAASQTYFSKPAMRLTLAESALLAGLPQKPSEYDPFRNKQAAVARRNDVLAAMLSQQMITKAQHDAAVAKPIQLKAGRLYTERRLPYFFNYVRDTMIQKYGAEAVRQGGMRVHTTIDPKMQRLAEKALQDTLPTGPSGAMVVLDTRTGAIRAMASSENYSAREQFNRAAQARRQPGSTAKIWVLAAFVLDKVNPDTTYYTSRPLRVRCTGCSEWWEPKTYDGRYGGSRSIRSATVASDNSVYAQMTLDIGAEKVKKVANRLGITSPLQEVWSIGLGSQVVTPLEQTNFYATIARGGVRRDPTAVERIETPGGGKLPLKNPAPRRVMADWQAWKVVDVLQDNMTGGTGTGAHIPGSDDSGKTGTTDDHKDAWFCGMTPELTACVWMGYNIPTPMPGVAGGSYPASIWRRFMEPALDLVDDRAWFRVRGDESWLPWNSTWQTKPGLDVGMATSSYNSDEAAERTSAPEEATPSEADTPSAAPTAGTTPPPAPTAPPAPVAPPPAPTAPPAAAPVAAAPPG